MFNKNKVKKSKFRLNVLSICGSGTVTSSMLAIRLEDILDEEGIKCLVDTSSPTQAENVLKFRKIDLVITSSILSGIGEIQCPVIDGHPLLSGVGEEEVIEEIKIIARQIIEEKELANQ